MAEDLNTHPPEEHRPDEGPDTLGGILAAARLEHGLTVEQMAAELRVEARLLEALEEDRFEILPAPVFVKGYLRHLASRFGLEYDDLVHRYAVQTDAEDAPVTYSEPIPEDNKLIVPLIVGALVLVLGIPAFWFTWVSRDTLSEIVSPDEEAPEFPPAQVESVPDAAAPIPDPGAAIEPAAPIPDPGAAMEPAAPPPGPGDTIEPAAPPPAVGLDTLPTPSTEAAPGVEAAPDDAPATGSGPAGAPAAVDESAGNPATVDEPAGAPAAVGQPAVETRQVAGPLVRAALSYAEDSWTEVSDGNGNSLYYALGRAGTTASFEGVLPLSFMLGNARGVQITINDQPWPVPAPQGNATTIRFVVNEAP